MTPFVFKKTSFIIAAGLLTATVLGGFFLLKHDRGAEERPEVFVDTILSEEKTVPLEQVETGTLEPISTTELSAKASGRISRLLVEEGSRVVAGQLLVELDASTDRALAESLHRNTQKAEENLNSISALYAERIKNEQSSADGGVAVTTGTYTLLTNTAALADQVSDVLGGLLGVRKGLYIDPEITFNTELGARNSAAKERARAELVEYQLLNMNYQHFFDASILGKTPNEATVQEGLTRADATLTAAKSVLNSAYGVLLDSIVSVSVSQNELDQRKQALTDLGLRAESILKGMHDTTSGLAVLKKERDTQVAQVSAEVVALQGQSAVADAVLSNSIVTAPYSGVITAKYSERGAVIGPGVPLLSIADDSRLRLRIGVSDVVAAQFVVGDTASVQVDGEIGEFVATITKIASVVDPISRKVVLELMIPNPKHTLKAGAFAHATLSRRTLRGIVVPSRAVVSRYGADYVFVVEGSVARRKIVDVGGRMNDQMVIYAGLTPGERVITSGNAYLRNGDPVIIATTTSTYPSAVSSAGLLAE